MKKLLKSFGYALSGIGYAAKSQVNFRIHLVAAITAISGGIYFELSGAEWLWIVLCIGFVLVLELLNTAIEVLVDLVSPDFNKKAGIVKDVSAGAVLVGALLAVVVAAIIFIPKII